MKNAKFALVTLIGFVAVAFTVGCEYNNNNSNMMAPQPVASNIRVIHTSYDAPAVDVSVDDAVAISNLNYGQSSGYAELNPGIHNIKVTPASQMSPIVIEANLDLMEDTDYTVFAVDQLSMIDAVVAVDDRIPSSNMAKIRFLHGSPDAPAVDIKLDNGNGLAVFENAAFGSIGDYVEVAGGSYTFAVTATGTTSEVVIFEPITVTVGSVYTVVAHGTLDDSDAHDFAVRVFIDSNDGNMYADLIPATAQVMVVHASPDAPGVDLLIDDAVINMMALESPDNTGYLTLGSGTHSVKVNVSGTSSTVISADLFFGGEEAYTVFASNDVAQIEALVLEDDLSQPASGMAHVRFVHLSPDAPAVDITLKDGSVVFGDIELLEHTAFTPLDAGMYHLQVRLAGTSTVVLDLPSINLGDGMIYTVFAKGFVAGSPDLGAEIIVNN